MCIEPGFRGNGNRSLFVGMTRRYAYSVRQPEGVWMDLLIALALATLLIRVGFALYAEGLVRAKNSASMVLRTITDLCIGVIAFWAIGAAILLQTRHPWFGVNALF